MAYGLNDGNCEEYLFKVVLLGDSAVGKTNLASRYVRDSFILSSKATVGVDYQHRTFNMDGKMVTAQIWDTAGQERFRSVTSAYYRSAVGALLVYDMTRRSTFENVTTWLEELRTYADNNVVIMLVGNKCDLKKHQVISPEEGRELADRENMFFIEVSALDTTNVTTAFETVVKEIFGIVRKKVITADSIEKDSVGQSVTLKTDADVNGAENYTKRFGCC